MDAEEALGIVETALGEERLSKLQMSVFRQTWNDLSYQEIARDSGYEVGYIKQTGSQLWQALSKALGEKVRKGNVHVVLKRYANRRQTTGTVAIQPQANGGNFPRQLATLSSNFPSMPSQDWGEAPDVSLFYGRIEELALLEQWILHDRCRLIGLFGMGGIGKTALSVKLAQQVSGVRGQGSEVQEAEHPEEEADRTTDAPHSPLPTPFTHVIWRSLRNAPPVHDLLTDLLLFLSHQQETVLPDSLDRCILKLLDYLRHCRCLLILDNAETVMQAGDRDGSYQPGYEGYGQLLRCVGETDHQSCLLLTSREKPKGFAPKEGNTLPIRSLQLPGIKPTTGRELFTAKGQFFGSVEHWQALIEHYAGNPLALKIVATAIADFFDGSIAQFLEFTQQGGSIFGDIRDLLRRQIGRLSDLEAQVMVWLAINREPVSFAELQADCLPPVSPSQLLDTLTALERRSLIEKSGVLFTLQPVVMEYMTEQLIGQVCEEITVGKDLVSLRSHALIKAQAKDYIRETQIRLILKPIVERLLHVCQPIELDERCMQILAQFRGRSAQETGYIGGNLINLLCQLQIDLSDRDLSNLTIWQAYLRKIKLHRTNLAASDLAKSAFTETFSQILAVAFSPDGKLLATSDISYEVHIWRVADAKKLLTCKAHDGWAWSVTFSPDSRLLASSANGTIHLWDLQTGDCVQTIRGYVSRVFSLAFSPDGCLLASGNEDHDIRLWSVATGELVAVLAGHTDEVHAVVFSPDGCLLASGSYDRTIKLWQLSGIASSLSQAPSPLAYSASFSGHTHWVWSVAFSPDGRTLASSSSDRTIKLWDPQTGYCLKTLTGHTQPIRSIAFLATPHPSPLTPHPSPVIVSGSDDQTIRLWNREGDCLRVLQGHTSWISAVAVSPDGYLLASGSEDQSVRLWDGRTNQCLRVLQGYNSGVWSAAFSPDGKILVSGGQDRTVRVWHLEEIDCPHPSPLTLSDHTSWIWSVAFSPEGETIASGSEDGTIKLWNLPTPHSPLPTPLTLSGHTHAVWSVAFSPNGQLIASGSLDGTVRLWNRFTGQCQQILKQHQSGVWSVAFAPQIEIDSCHRQLLASGSQDQTIQLWQVFTGDPASSNASELAREATVQPLKTLAGHSGWIRSIAFSPDGQVLASASSDGTVKFWQIATGDCLQTFQAHSSLVLAVTFSPDGQTLATGGGDATIKLWDVSRINSQLPTPLISIAGHHKWVRSLAYSPTGEILASCSQDGSVKLWQIDPNNISRQKVDASCRATLRVPRPYEGTIITGVTGLTEAQKETLQMLGAIDA